MIQTVIQVDGLTKKYGTAYGIKDLTFSVNRGEIFGFLGPNGAGKTTSIRMMVDLLRPTSGEVQIFGENVLGHAYPILKRTSYLPGEFYPFPELTGHQYLRLATRMKKGKKDNVQELIHKMDLTELDLRKRIKFYSRGMKQKLGLIQSFAYFPELIIMDEPTSGLDPLMQSTFHELVKEASAHGTTVFLSSHQLSEVEKICQRVAIVRAGKLVSLESLESLKKKRYRRLRLVLKTEQTEIDIPESIIQKREGKQVWLLTRAPAEELIQALALLPIEDFHLYEPDLEEVFLSYYQSETNDK